MNWDFVSPQGAYIGAVRNYAPDLPGTETFSDLVVLEDSGYIPAPPIVTARRALFYLPDGRGASGLRLAIAAATGYATLEPDTVFGKIVDSFEGTNEGTERLVKLYVVEVVDAPAGSPYAVGDTIAVNEQRLFRERDGYAFVYHGAGWLDPFKDFYFNAVPI